MAILMNMKMMVLYVAAITNCFFWVEGQTLSQAVVMTAKLDQLNPNCYLADCLQSASPDCHFLNSPNLESIISNFEIYRDCMLKQVCGVRLDPFTISHFSQEITVPFYSGTCRVSGSSVKAAQVSQFQLKLKSRQPSPATVEYAIDLIVHARWTAVDFQCNSKSCPNTLLKVFNLFDSLNCILGLLLQLPPNFSGTITGSLAVKGRLIVNIGSGINVVSATVPTTVADIDIDSSAPEILKPALKAGAKRLFESSALANAIMENSRKEVQTWLRATKETC